MHTNTNHLPKAIFVGPEKLANIIINKYSQDSSTSKFFNFVNVVPDIPSLWKGLEDKTISNEVDVILTTDILFNNAGENNDFEQLIAIMAPYCFFGIFSYLPELENKINKLVKTQLPLLRKNDETLYYFIDKDSPTLSIQNSVKNYVTKSSNKDIVQKLAKAFEFDSTFAKAGNMVAKSFTNENNKKDDLNEESYVEFSIINGSIAINYAKNIELEFKESGMIKLESNDDSSDPMYIRINYTE